MVSVIFDTNIQGGYFDRRRTKSSLDAPAAYCKDLLGCGINTHLASSGSGTVNDRNLCDPLERVAGGSFSALEKLSAGGAFPIITDNVVVTVMDDVLSYMAEAHALYADSGIPLTTVPAAPIMPVGYTPQLRGKTWISDGAEFVATVDIPRVVPVYNQCNEIAGYTTSTSYSYAKYNPETCVPELVSQFSLRMFAISAERAGALGLDVDGAAGILALWTPFNFPGQVGDINGASNCAGAGARAFGTIPRVFGALPATVTFGTDAEA